jgi:hypothetical protein
MSNSQNYNNELEKKKELLKKEILEKNKDQNSFINFCMSKKQNGDDLNNWGLEELKEIIIEFNSKHNISIQNQSQLINNNNPKINQNTNALYEKIDTNKLQVVETNKSKSIFLECKKLEKTILNDKKINIIIRNPITQESTNFLSSNYILYEVYTKETNWNVQRRYSDFEWLRNTLTKYFPFKLIAPIPGKKLGNRRFKVDFIEKRMNFLQKFINCIIKDEYFKSSEILISFLSIIDRIHFENKMKELSSYIPSKYVQDLKSFNSKVEISTEQSNDNGELNNIKNPSEDYYTNIKYYFQLQNTLLERLNYNLKFFYKSMKVCCNHLEEVRKNFENINQLNVKISMREPIKTTYEEFGIFIKNWKRILSNQNEQIKESIKDFFKYARLEGNSFSEIFVRREEIRNKYINESNSLRNKKEKLWTENNITKWEIIDGSNKIDTVLLLKDKNYAFKNMCTQETLNVENLKFQLGYANKMITNELMRYLNENSEKFMENMKDFVEKFYPSLTDGISIWTTLANYC